MLYLFCQVANRDLVRISEIYGPSYIVGGTHQAHESVHHIVHKAKGSSLVAITIQRYRLSPKCLNDKIGYNAPVVGMHARSVTVEYSCYLYWT